MPKHNISIVFSLSCPISNNSVRELHTEHNHGCSRNTAKAVAFIEDKQIFIDNVCFWCMLALIIKKKDYKNAFRNEIFN